MTRIAIVLGAAVRPDGSPSPALRRRAEHAADLYRQGRVERIIASGGVPQAGRSEADVIKEICEALGVPPEVIEVEDGSTNTRENIANSRNLLPSDASVVLVTDRYHALRAKLTARDFGVQAEVASPDLNTARPDRVIKGISTGSRRPCTSYVSPGATDHFATVTVSDVPMLPLP